jgi:hypothetical protein
MTNLLLGGYAVLVAMLIGVASFVALFGMKKTRQEYGFRVLRLLLTSAAGAGGVLMLFVKLQEFGP